MAQIPKNKLENWVLKLLLSVETRTYCLISVAENYNFFFILLLNVDEFLLLLVFLLILLEILNLKIVNE